MTALAATASLILTSMVTVLAIVAALLQATALFDRTIHDAAIVDRMRKLRIGTWLIVAGYIGWRGLVDGTYLSAMPLLCLLALCLADAVTAAVRILPEQLHCLDEDTNPYGAAAPSTLTSAPRQQARLLH